MTDLLELSLAELTAYTAVIGAAKGEDQFVVAFVELLEYLVDHTHRPYEVAAAFVCGTIEGRAIVEAPSLEAFVPSFAAYVKDIITLEAVPYEKIARFVYSMIEGSCEAIAEMLSCRRGAVA